jgi:hypothetical protein
LSKSTVQCPGWDDLKKELPILTEEEERKFLFVMLEELNVKFALQLDANPSTKRFGFDADDSETESAFTIVLAGGSHSSRMLADTYLRVVDVSVPDFRISEETVANTGPLGLIWPALGRELRGRQRTLSTSGQRQPGLKFEDNSSLRGWWKTGMEYRSKLRVQCL